MKAKDVLHAKDKDIALSVAAMRRAAQLAREQVVRTNTSLIVLRNQTIVRISAAELQTKSDH